MKSITSLATIASVLFAASTLATVNLGPNAVGCYTSVPGYTFNATLQFNTNGACQTACQPLLSGTIATTKGGDCWCGGNELPADSYKTDNNTCSTPCNGFGTYTCGGPSAWTVYLTPFSASVSTAVDGSASSSSTATATTSSIPSVVTQPGSTVVVTADSSSNSATSSTSPSPSSQASKSPSTAGIAIGVVVGIGALAAIAGGIFLYLRNKKRREVEEEYRRNAAVSSFINAGGKPPNSSGGASSFTDTRLDATVMAQRRMSDGSIADNQDYSRRILKDTTTILNVI
ncbi:hypothetical protein G7Y89_g7540 [Cudoniella acicularis]|uniref:WSC domain-containing protein n=1 Tax=Cudoniella acicularis TaxID=354080 RepID=A0A8H4RIC6_9HELO|nr:hypothetical protein G7Y89_g7540 [Cudoniella acicularis]